MSFKKTLIATAVLSGVVILPSQASTLSNPLPIPEPNITVSVGGTHYEVPSDFIVSPHKGEFDLSTPWTQQLPNHEGTVSVNSFDSKSDPSTTFAFAATNNTDNPLTYSFSFNSALSPPLTSTILSASSLGETLSRSDAGTAYVNPIGNNLLLTAFDIKQDGTQVPKNVDIGTGFSHLFSSAGTVVNNEGTKNGTLDCGSAAGNGCVTMSGVLSFVLSPHSAVGISGTLTQTPSTVPVPSSVWLFGSALAGIGAFGRRRRAAGA